MFSEFGKRIRPMMSPGVPPPPPLFYTPYLTPFPFAEQLLRIYDQLVIFVHEAEAEHRDRLAGYIPASVPEYLRKRFNSSGCYPGFFMFE